MTEMQRQPTTVLVRLTGGEEYDDCAPELLAEDVMPGFIDGVTWEIVRLSDEEARIKALEAENRQLLKLQRCECGPDEACQVLSGTEARATAAEALLKEAGKALEPFAQEADAWEGYSDIEAIVEDFPSYFGRNIRVGDLRAARAIHHKIGVKDE